MVLENWHWTPFTLGTNSHLGLNLSVRVTDHLVTEAEKKRHFMFHLHLGIEKKETLNIKINYCCKKFPGSSWAELSRAERSIIESHPMGNWWFQREKQMC